MVVRVFGFHCRVINFSSYCSLICPLSFDPFPLSAVLVEVGLECWKYVRRGVYLTTLGSDTTTSTTGIRNFLNFLLWCGTWPYVWGTHWDSNSLVKVCLSCVLTITPTEAPKSDWYYCRTAIVHRLCTFYVCAAWPYLHTTCMCVQISIFISRRCYFIKTSPNNNLLQPCTKGYYSDKERNNANFLSLRSECSTLTITPLNQPRIVLYTDDLKSNRNTLYRRTLSFPIRTVLFLSTFSPGWHEERDANHKSLGLPYYTDTSTLWSPRSLWYRNPNWSDLIRSACTVEH